MKILQSLQYAFALLICTEIIYAQDFKIAPNTPLSEGSDFYNASIASDQNSGFLVTWINWYQESSTAVSNHNYACRVSKTGEMLDSVAIYLPRPGYTNYCPSAVFAGGNWIIAVNQGGLVEYVGAIRLTPSGVVLDTLPVNICPSIGMATIVYPNLATNGQEILCVTAVAGEGLYGAIFDSGLNILVDRFPIFSGAWASTAYRVCANGNNFFITFLHWDDDKIKLVIVNPEGQILSTQDVSEDYLGYPHRKVGVPTIITLNDTTYITYFEANALWVRRYSPDGNPIDSGPVKIFESQDFHLFLKELSWGAMAHGYTDLVWANGSFHFFWPRMSELGISMLSFKPDLSLINNQPVHLNSQCQCKFHVGELGFHKSYSIIRAASIGNKVLTAWIDGREGYGRVYCNFLDVNTAVENETDEITIPEDFSLSQNYPNPFNSSTKISYALSKSGFVTLKVYNMLGREIQILVNEFQKANDYTVHFNANDLASGIYFYKLFVGSNFVETKKMVLMR